MRSLLHILNNILKPPGCFIVLIGPDGCGKSTVTAGLISNSHKHFNGVWHFHWRPKLFPKLSSNKNPAKTNEASDPPPPPNTSKYRGLTSLIRYLYYWLDFVIGYWLLIHPKRIKSSLIIGERYFPDVLVHPERYGFDVPRFLMRITAMLVPNPDITFLLTGEPADIYTRKQELSIDEIKEQLNSYSEVLTQWGSHALIDTSDGAEHVIEAIELHIHALRNSSNSDNITLITKYAFPSIGTAKLILDPSMPVHLVSKLYSPGSFSGRALLSIAKVLGYRFGAFIFRRIESFDFGRFPLSHSEIIIKEQHGDDAAISYYLGNRGPRSKVTAQISCGDALSVYTKIGFGDEVTHLLINEYQVLNDLKDILGSSIPSALSLINDNNHSYLTQTAPDCITRKRDHSLNSRDSSLIHTTFRTTARTLSFEEYCKELNILDRVDRVTTLLYSDDTVTNIKNAVNKLLSSSMSEVVVGRCHGDYTVWNTLVIEDEALYVFDWEYSRVNGPAISDLFHFLRMYMQMIMRLTPDVTYNIIFDRDNDHYHILENHAFELGIDRDSLHEYFALYLIQEILRHAESGSSSEIAQQIYPSQLPQIRYLSDCLMCYVNNY